jgi:hypothetical protein
MTFDVAFDVGYEVEKTITTEGFAFKTGERTARLSDGASYLCRWRQANSRRAQDDVYPFNAEL